nr:BCCT family transporter [Nitrosomonas sp.]
MEKYFAHYMQMLKDWRAGILPPVFFTAAALSVAFIFFAGIWSQTAARWFGSALSAITHYFDWFYIAITAALVVCAVWLLFSRYGRLRLGKPNDRPQFSYTAWLAMLFAAGMGMGLVFW